MAVPVKSQIKRSNRNESAVSNKTAALSACSGGSDVFWQSYPISPFQLTTYVPLAALILLHGRQTGHFWRLPLQATAAALADLHFHAEHHAFLRQTKKFLTKFQQFLLDKHAARKCRQGGELTRGDSRLEPSSSQSDVQEHFLGGAEALVPHFELLPAIQGPGGVPTALEED